MSTAGDLFSFGRFALGLPSFLRQRMTIEETGDLVRHRIRDREARFASMLRQGFFTYPGSPYTPLFELAGCTPAEIARMVERTGLEETLESLRAAGVYISFEEFKGRSPIVRHGTTIPVTPGRFDNPFLSKSCLSRSGGTSGAGVRVSFDLDFLTETTPNRLSFLDAHGVLDAPTAIWYGILPDSTGINNLLRSVLYDNVPRKWFSPVTSRDYRSAFKHRLATSFILATARLGGVRLPRPEPVGLAEAVRVARWAAETAAREGKALVRAHASMALRVCLAADEAGLDLSRVTLMGGGEPPTPAKVKRITETGAAWVPTYVSSETGPIGWGCANPDGGNDLHFLKDSLALIQHPLPIPGITDSVDAFFFTSLIHAAPKILLNVENDDHGVLEKRPCGCPLERLGFTEHLRDVRSMRKLTGEGVTLVGGDLVRILEEVLPGRFGGSAHDYQMVEDEDGHGFTRLTLRVHPRVSLENESAVTEVLMRALRGNDTASDLAGAVWKQAGTVTVSREKPYWTPRGKFMPLVLSGRSGATEEDL